MSVSDFLNTSARTNRRNKTDAIFPSKSPGSWNTLAPVTQTFGLSVTAGPDVGQSNHHPAKVQGGVDQPKATECSRTWRLWWVSNACRFPFSTCFLPGNDMLLRIQRRKMKDESGLSSWWPHFSVMLVQNCIEVHSGSFWQVGTIIRKVLYVTLYYCA